MRELLDSLKEGVRAGKGTLLKANSKKGRFVEEVNLDLYIHSKRKKELVLHAKLFFGRGHYRRWIELFGLRKEVLGEPFFGSQLESFILDLFSPFTGRLFVEYFEDSVTAGELKRGVPPALSRMGFELAKRGFTYVRDWYIPEGLMEGGHKLQGERADRRDLEERRFTRLKEELESFLQRSAEEELKETALRRFKILEGLWKRKLS